MVAKKTVPIVIVIALVCLTTLTPLSRLPVAAATVETTPEETAYALMMPTVQHSAQAAIVLETSRLRSLYDLNGDSSQNIPAASKIMTALIACERLEPATLITISKVAAAVEPKSGTPDGIKLKTGDKYPLHYLLCRLIYYNSDAAAIAIAEQIASVEADFVELMNAKAQSFEMVGTRFENCTGVPSAENLQYSTPYDLALLVNQANLNASFHDIISSQNEFFILEGTSEITTLHNVLQNIWTRSEGTIHGAFYSEYGGKSYLVAIGAVNSIDMIAVVTGGSPAAAESDLLALFRGCQSYYISTPLVTAGDLFSGAKGQTVDGEIFDLVFKKTVFYTHPINSDFLKPGAGYLSAGQFSRPIQTSMTVGQVVFELLDGTTIAVDVSPAEQILSSISILDSALNVLQSNGNLAFLLIVCGIFLLLILLANVVIGCRRLLHLARLIVMERRSRR